MICVRFSTKMRFLSNWKSLATARNVWTSSSCRQQEQTSENPQQKLYELRIYTINPSHFREFLSITTEEFHLRISHSKLLGYWMSEIGGINQVVHFWEYDTLSHRASVRANLAGDEVWNSRYLGRVIGMFQEMNNSLLTLLPGTEINTPAEKGVYELQTLNLSGAPVMWSQALMKYVKACNGINMGATKLVGAWQSVIGPRQMATLLWQHPGPDSCVSLHQATNSLDESTELASHVADGHSRLLIPHPVSPLQ